MFPRSVGAFDSAPAVSSSDVQELELELGLVPQLVLDLGEEKTLSTSLPFMSIPKSEHITEPFRETAALEHTTGCLPWVQSTRWGF